MLTQLSASRLQLYSMRTASEPHPLQRGMGSRLPGNATALVCPCLAAPLFNPLSEYSPWFYGTNYMYIWSTRIPNLSGYVSGCPLRNGVTRCVTGRPDAQLQIESIHDNRLHNGAVPLRNRASSRLSRYPFQSQNSHGLNLDLVRVRQNCTRATPTI